jgi:heat shock protein HslJ
MKNQNIIVIIAVVVVLGGLYLFTGNLFPAGQTAERTPANTEEGAVVEPIREGTYKLALFGGASDTTPRDLSSQDYTLVIADGQVRGKICNSFSGLATAQDGKVASPGLASTKMACVPDVMEVETALFSALTAGADYRASADGLILMGGAGTLFVFQKI